MLCRHKIAKPDRRPLYQYRFTLNEYERARAQIANDGVRALQTPEGCALFVMVLAEWFRRDRDGGGWSWDPPLASLGFKREEYGASGPKTLRYSELQDAVSRGLTWWRRPGAQEIDGLRYVWAVVRESGLPLSEVRRASWLRAWVNASVQQMFNGLPVSLAVEQERARRAHSEALSVVIFDVVCELVEKVFEFKRLINSNGDFDEDPVLRLTRIKSDWLDELPVPAEAEDLRALIADALRTSCGGEDVFSAERVLERVAGQWRSAIKLGLDGQIDLLAVSAELRAALEGASRAQLFLRSSGGRASSRAVALIERSFSADGEALTARALGRDLFEVELDEEVTLVCQVGERAPVLIAPRGASPQSEAVLAFAASDQDEAPERLRMVSNASVAHRGQRLFLLIETDRLADIVWAAGTQRSEPEPVDQSRVLVSFSGEARLESDGLTRIWKTGCAEGSGAPLVLDGRYTTVFKPAAYLGEPRVLHRDGGALVEARREALLWRPKGRGRWRRHLDEAPLGEVEIGLAEEGVLIGVAQAVLLPEEFSAEVTAGKSRVLALSGLAGADVTTRTQSLAIVREAGRAQLDLSGLAPGSVFDIQLSWGDRRARFKARDLSLANAVLMDGLPVDGCPFVGAGTLFQYSAWSRASELLMFELAGQGGQVGFVRKVTGDTPLTVYRDEIRALLSQSDQHEARVDIHWRGAGRALQVRRYDLDPPRSTWARPVDETISYLRAQGVENLILIPLLAPENGCQLVLEDTAAAISYPALAQREAGPGPWVLTGRGADRGRMRPIFIATDEPGVPETDVQAALLLPSGRRQALIDACQTVEGRRHFAALALATARAASRHQIPPVSFDILSVLTEAPDLAVHVLAAAVGRADLDIILDLESDLALVWPAISSETWRMAFVEQFKATRASLRKAGIDSPSLAADPLVEHLGQISRRPDLRVQAARTAHELISMWAPDEAKRREAEAPFERAIAEACEDSYSDLAQAMIKRRVDGVDPPRLGLDAAYLGDLLGRFQPQFDGVLAAPRIAASAAVGRLHLTPDLIGQLRLARLFDPEFFDRGVSRTAVELLRTGKV